MSEKSVSPLPELIPALGEPSTQGVIVREADGAIDFSRLYKEGFTLVYLRATSGNDYVDCRLKLNAKAAAEAGMEVGYYHYLTARNADQARQQASLFLTATEPLPADLRPAMIFDRFRGLSVSEINQIAEAFLSRVQHDRPMAPMLRTDVESANQIWSPALAQRYPLWIIDPDVSAPRVVEGKWKGWTGWEYGDMVSVNPLPVSLFTPNVRLSSAPQGDTKYICVTVAYGDTLSAIAKTYGVSVKDIVRLNAIPNPNRIFPGQTLFLRVPSSSSAPCCDLYTVRRGDTLSGIAARFGTTVDRLVSINEIPDEDLIAIGQKLRLGFCAD